MASFGDFNRINTNIESLTAQLSLNRINRQLGTNQLRMATGLRINRAEDNAAGFSIATKLSSRIAGLSQARSNVGDAKSVLDIAESSFSTIMDSLIQMKGLATQASNDTLGATERGYLAEQIKALGKDINEVSNQTVYQDYSLLKGNGGTNTGGLKLTFQVGERASDVITTTIESVNVHSLFFGGGKNNAAGATELGGDIGAITVTATAGISASNGGELNFTNAKSSDFRAFISAIDSAIDQMSKRVNKIGITQSSLSIREVTLSKSISANSSAVSRIMDTDFAKVQSESIRLLILQQTAISALAQANNGPQTVLGFLK
jgi:flagellin